MNIQVFCNAAEQGVCTDLDTTRTARNAGFQPAKKIGGGVNG